MNLEAHEDLTFSNLNQPAINRETLTKEYKGIEKASKTIQKKKATKTGQKKGRKRSSKIGKQKLGANVEEVRDSNEEYYDEMDRASQNEL